MKLFKNFIFVFFVSFSWAQTWQWTGRTHGELDWTTIETEHFRIHHHQGIESIAKEGASIAEQVYPLLLKQMELKDIPTIDIIFTSEDEIMNGFALWTNTTFIWVDQNDAAIWLEDEKWLYQVVSHELQHIFFFHKIETWIPEPWSFLLSKTPGWVVEGLAEYETERWRPYRADISHKYHILKNKTKEMDPHHDGFSKLLYWSNRFGDSTIVNTLSEQNKIGLFNFEDAFKKHTGITVDQFNEDWRRQMNTYYYGYRAQKEAIEEIGKVVTLPIKKLGSFSFYSDSTRMAITGMDDEGQFDQSLYIIQRDTTKEKEQREKRKKAEKKESKKEKMTGIFTNIFKKQKQDEKKKNPKPILVWDKKEVDYGSFQETLSWSPDGRKLAYSKYHFGENQSMVNDIKVYDLDSKKSTWMTHSMRATYPDWAPDGENIVFVAHENSIANLYTMNPDGSNINKITDYTYDTQILNPHYSPDGQSIVFAMADQEANLDLFLLTMDLGEIRRLTNDPSADYGPVWHPGGDFISYTSHAGSTPNIHTLNLTTGESRQVTDVGDAVWAAQWSVVDSSIMAVTLPDVDTVRIANVDPHRYITTKDLTLRELYTDWREAKPNTILKDIDPKKDVSIVKIHDYTPSLGFKHLTSLVLPIGNSIIGFTQWADAMTRHIFTGIGLADFSQGKTHRFLLQYINAMGGPMWGINVSSLFDIKIKPYDRSKWGLLEENNSIAVWSNLPYNTGNSTSGNHVFGVQLKITDRNASIIEDVNESTDEIQIVNTRSNSFLPAPASGKEGLFSIHYIWKNMRPHKQNIMIPKQGSGFNAQLDVASSSVFGDFDFTKITTDAFFNWLPHKKSPVVVFGRIKTVTMLGNNPPPQDMPAITNDTPIYLGGNNVFGSDEVVHLRGWDDWRLGDRVIFGTIEPRLGNEKVTAATFIDFGNAWYSNGKMDDWLFTAGYELRVNLIGFVIAYGTAQDFNRWRDGEWPVNYIRLSLVNPF